MRNLLEQETEPVREGHNRNINRTNYDFVFLRQADFVHIYDIAEADGVQFISMEYVPGKTLDQLIGHRGLRLNEALKYAVQIADALAQAHSAGINSPRLEAIEHHRRRERPCQSVGFRYCQAERDGNWRI